MVKLPRRLVIIIAVVVTGLLVYNVVADINSSEYEGYPTTLLLGTILGGLLGIHRFLRIEVPNNPKDNNS